MWSPNASRAGALYLYLHHYIHDNNPRAEGPIHRHCRNACEVGDHGRCRCWSRPRRMDGRSAADDGVVPVTADETDVPATPKVFVVTPRPNGGGTQLHLYAPAYRTQKPRSEHYPSALCGQSAAIVHGTERTGLRPNGRRHVPIREALEWLRPPADPPANPLLPPWPTFTWCGHCLGRLVVWLDPHDQTWLITELLDKAGIPA